LVFVCNDFILIGVNADNRVKARWRSRKDMRRHKKV